MGRYGGWGAADGVFAPGASGNDLRDRERLRAVLARLGGSTEAGERLFRAAGLTVLNAHYTDPVLVRTIYRALADLGLEQGTIVEPGVGAGQFAAFAPGGIRITGIELDPATALIAQLLHPDAEILVGSVSGPRFARVRDQSASPVRVPRDTADGFAGNVPFSDVKWPDEVLNPGSRFPLHDHAIMWGVTRVTPGGLCAFITSRYTADKQNPGFRRTLAGELDLIGMVRLPSAAHKRMAGTQVVTDIIIGRRLADGERPLTDPGTWEQARPLPLPGSDLTALVNTYFHDNPQHVLGTLKAGGMHRAGDFSVIPSGDLEQQLGAALSEIADRARAAGQRFQPRPAARPVIEILSRRPDGTVTANTDGTFTQVIHGQDEPLAISSPREASQTRTLAALAEARAALIRAEAGCPEDTGETDALRARMGELYDAYTDAYGAIGRFTVRTTNYHVKTLKGVLDRLDFSKADVPDPEVTLLEAYLGRDALTLIVTSAADPGHVRHGTRKDKQGNVVATETRLVQVARVRAALTAALAQIPQGADAERLTAAFGERMSRIETGEQRTRLMPVAFRSDPRRPAVEALENFDPVTQTATRKPVFSRRTAVPRRLELGADTPEEALDLVLIHRRRVDLGEIARLLGTDEASARKQLGTLVFDDPAGGSLVAAGEYLSGDVHEKLTRARAAAAADPGRYTVNVESLQAVQPPALAAEDIQARLGSAWLSRQIVQDGLRHILEDPTLTVTHPGGAGWTVSTRKDRNSNAQDRYGTSDWNAIDLAQALLTNASIAVYRSYIDPATGNEKKYRDDAATLFSYRKAQRLDADFVSWLWSDPDRAEECVRLYNAAYNNQVKRKWDSAPFYIPGLAPGIRLHPFQNAMARRLHTDSGLAAWVVGAGKTELGIVAAMEGNRLGRHQLAAVVCPAGLVSQWSNRIYSTYPQARALVADDDLRNRKDAREMFTERAASGDYQLAVVPYEFFGSLPLSADAARASADEEIDKLTRYAEEAAAQGDRHTAKALQGQIARIEAQYSAAAQGAGGAVTFTDARIDSVIVDEWHNFRRITRDSNNRAMAIIKGSDRADHMLAVFDYLRKRHPEGLLLGLSGTPLEQSIADAWAAMRFFAPERLKELGLEEFDAFLTTFGRTEARREPTPTGSGLHVRERASDWFNLPEMRRALWDPFADVVRSADLGLNVPRLTGGRPQTHVLPQTPGQASTQADIDEGYARFKAGNRGPDNHILRLMDRAAKNALHPRMLGMETDGKIKLEVWAEDAAAWYHATKDTRFLDREGNPHPVPGALRMVACELGVPDPARANAWSVYSEMRSLLAARGVPAGAVRFAQDAAGSDRKKAALWEDARTGRCNFVIGSAQTAGTGVDVPDRLQVLDYMTLSWNPTQFEQWLGRIVRQGNQNPEVAANVWATEGTIEVLRADKIAMKSAPFEALLDGTSETRRVNEKTYDPLSAWAADMATRMSGNPLLNAQREAQLEVDTAQGMQNEWQRENGVKARRIAVMTKEIQELEERNAAIDGALSRAVDTRGGKFKAQVGTVRYTVRAEAGTALIAALAATAAGDVSALADGNPQHLGELAGFPVTARYRRFTLDPPAQADDGQDDGPDPEPAERTMITVGLEGVPNGQVPVIDAGDLPGRDPAALITSLEDRIRRLPGARDANTAAITENRDQIARTRAELAKPSPYLQPLADARDALDRIEAEIDQQLKDATAEPDAAVPEGAEPVPVPPGEPGADDSAEAAAIAAAPAVGDLASLPPWTASSPHSAAITVACQAALADSNLTQVARSNDLDRFLEWLSGSGWAPGYAAAAIGDDSQIPPLAQAILEDPVFAEDLTCAIGTAVHARCTGQAPPPGSAARRPVPPRVEMSALAHWQENDEATGRAAATDQWHDLVTAAQIDIWLSRSGLPRQGRHVRSDPGGHAVLELTAAGGEQWRLTVPRPQDAQHEATARYSLTRSGRDGWTSLLNGTPGSTTPEQAAALITSTLTEEGALPLPSATPAPDQAAPGAAQAGQPAGLSHAPAPRAGGPQEGTPAPVAEDGEEDQEAGTEGWALYAGQRDALVSAFHSAHDGPPAAMRGAAQARDRQNFQVAFTIWGRRRLEATAVEAISDAVANSAPPPEWARAVDGDATLAATLVTAAAAGVWRDLMAAADAAGAPGPAAKAGPQPGVPSPGAGAAPAAAAPGASHAGQAASGSGMSREDLDFAYQHAYDFVIGTVRDPGFAQEERALDYAAWYMATFGREESLDELPGHDHAWGWFADRGYPARDLAATPGGQRDQGRAGMEATAEAAGPPGHAGTEPAPGEARPDKAASADSQLPAAAPHPAAGIPGQDPGTTPGPVHGAPAGHPLAGTGAAPPPAAARELVPPVTVLHGHVSEDTAVEVTGYPYGSLRCTMRYWLETDRRGQVRRVHQTTNPKRPGEPRNKPHRDTYSSWAVLYRAASGHVELHATGYWGPSPALDARIRLDGTYDQLDDGERAAYDKHVARSLNGNTRGWEDWRTDLAGIRGHLAEHGTLPDPGQLAQARGHRLHEADAVAAVAAVAAGLGGNHAAPPAAPGQPGTTAPDPAAEVSVLMPRPPVAPVPEPPGPLAAQTPPAHAAPEPPAPGSAAGLRQIAAGYGLAADTARTGGTLTVTVHDQGRTILLHDDISGTTAAGVRLDPAEVPAYLGAYARHPQLPPRCLLDLARHEPADPAPLTLTAARETAARHGLAVRVRRAGGQSYITFCEPGTAAETPGDITIPGLPVLSYPAGSGSARHGPCTVPVAAIGSYLAAYRDNVPPAMFTGPEQHDWRRRVAPLTPHLIDGSGHFIPAARDRLRTALAAARDDRAAEARTLLAEAEALTPVTLDPEREAELTAVVRRDTARYRHAEDPAASLATTSLQTLDVTARELDWVRAYIAGHPEIREHAEETGPAAGSDRDREAATGLAQQAQQASDRGDYQRALALIDEIELLRPRGSYETARDHVRAAMSKAARANRQARQPAQEQTRAAGDHTEAGTPPAAGSPAADSPPAGPVSGTDTDETAIASPAAVPGPDAERRQASGTVPEPVPVAAVEPEAVSPGTGRAADATGTAAPAGPGQAGRYTARIRISTGSGPPTVSGTSFDDPAELREALRASFTWRKRRQLWEYTGRREGPLEAVEALRQVLTRLDRDSAAPTAKEFPPTHQQQAILDAFRDGKDIAVQALAGTGKTTTLVLLARALMDRSPQARIVYTAFNASIVADARRGRFGRNVTASTMHSLARQALLQTSYAAKIEHADQGARWPEQWADVLGIPEATAAETRDGAVPADAAEIARLVIASVRKFRESADGEPGRQHLPYLAGPAGSPLSRTVLSYARKAWADISDPGNARLLAAGRALRVEHDDYLKIWALSRPQISAEVIFFDEAQDVNDVMRRVILDQPAQTVVVGDSHQSIYGFRGAIDALKDWPADIVLPLTQSWRFGPDAAAFGNLFLRSLDSKLLLEGNPARDTRLGSAAEPDAILCRTNATAVAEVFAGLESGKRTALAGGGQAIREIAKAARDLQAGKGTKHPDLSRFADWDEVRHYAQHEEDGKSLQVLVRLIDRHGPGGLIDMIGRLTPEGDTSNPPQLTISTAHKAKGLEWDVVRVAGDFRGPVTNPETGEVTWPAPEERRLAYVAATRARKLLEPGSLNWINDYPLPGARHTQGPAQGKDSKAQAAVPGAARIQPDTTAQTGQEQDLDAQDSQDPAHAGPRHDRTAGASEQQHTPAPAEAPASARAAGEQATGAGEPDARQQSLAEENEAGPQPGSPDEAPAVSQQAADAGGDHPTSPDDPEEPGAGQAPGGPGLTQADREFAYQHARDYALGSSHDPGPEREERAQDYATWYLAAYSDRESIADLPGHHHAWEQFTGQGHPAREPAATAEEQRDQDQPATGAGATPARAIPASIQAAGTDPRETATPGDAQLAAATATAPPRPAPAGGTSTRPGHGQPAGNGPTGPGASPLTNSDLAAELRRFPGFARWLSQATAPAAAGDLDAQRHGAPSSAVYDERGIEITVSAPGFTRHGLVTWPQAASWIDNGVTPARLGLAVIADQLSTFCRDHRDQLTAAGSCDPDATAGELAQIRDSAIAMVVGAALRSRGAAAPVPPPRPGDPAWYTARMITRPERGAGKAENAALERLLRLREIIREPQPATPAGIRAEIRHWTGGHGLADLVRALDSPAAMRTWISEQASRAGAGSYDSSGDCWHGATADGLISDRRGDDRAPALTRWEEIPAWIQPGITGSLRDSLLAADGASSTLSHRRLTAAIHPGASHTAPTQEEEDRARLLHDKAIAAAWAAIAAAPPPTATDLERARHLYRDTGPVQDSLFGDPPEHGTHTQDHPGNTAANPPVTQPQPGQAHPPADQAGLSPEPALPAPGEENQQEPGTDRPVIQDADTPGHAATAGPTPASAPAPAQAGPADGDDPEPVQMPPNNSDLAIALGMSPYNLNRFLTAGETTHAHGGSGGWRRKGLPDAGVSEHIYRDRRGIEIILRSRTVRRQGLISWRQVASWIDAGITPARLGILIGASGTWMFTYARREQLIADGKEGIDAALSELRQISDDVIEEILRAAVAAHGADAPVPPARPGRPAYRTTARLTRPDPSASAEVNTALARIAELDAAIRGIQPCTPADLKGAIRWWIGDSLPEYARALASPEAMRTWIRRQAAGPASRPAAGHYDRDLGRYYGAHPEGLRTSKGSDTRAEPWILWEEIPAWILPGLPPGLRAQLDAAARQAPARKRTTAARKRPGTADLDGPEAGPLPGPLREAIDAAWAAIEAALPPSPADLEHARTVYRQAGTVQELLPASPVAGARPGRTVSLAHGQDELPAAAEDSSTVQDSLSGQAAAEIPGPAADSTVEGQAAGLSETVVALAAAAVTHPPGAAAESAPEQLVPAGETAAVTGAGGGHGPLTADDIYYALRMLDPAAFAGVLRAAATGQHLRAPARTAARQGEPGAGTRDTITAAPEGLRIEAAGPGGPRTSTVPWADVGAWLQPGLGPAQRETILQACRARLRYQTAGASFVAAGEADLARAAEDELLALAAAQAAAVLDRARAAHAGNAPQDTGNSTAPAAPGILARIADLASALPAEAATRTKPLSQVQPGDIIGHPGYKLQPFRVSAPPARHGSRAEITGQLTTPAGGEPAGQITLVITAAQPDPPVHMIPLPARSLQPLITARAGTGPGHARPARPPRQGRRMAATRPGGPGRAQGTDAAPRPASRQLAPAGHGTTTQAQQAEEATMPEEPARALAPRTLFPASELDAYGVSAQLVPGGGERAAGNGNGNASPAGSGQVGNGQHVSGQNGNGQNGNGQHVSGQNGNGQHVSGQNGNGQSRNGQHVNGQSSNGQHVNGTRQGGAPPDGSPRRGSEPDEEAQLRQACEDALTAIIQRRRAAAGDADAEQSVAGIRAAFAVLQQALAGDDPAPEPAGPDPEPERNVPHGLAPAEAGGNGRGAEQQARLDGEDDLTGALEALLRIAAAPARGRHTRGPDGPHPDEVLAGMARAAAEARASAAWYSAPQWQRITAIGQAAGGLVQAVRDASAGYWEEIRLDLRVRGFARTVAAHVARGVAHAAAQIADSLAYAGHQGSRPYRAAVRLCRASIGVADRLIGYPQPPAQAGPAAGQDRAHAGRPQPGGQARQDAAVLARASFPGPLGPALVRQGAGESRRRSADLPAGGRHAGPAR